MLYAQQRRSNYSTMKQVYFYQKSCLHCNTHGSCHRGCLCAAALPEQINVQKNHDVIQKTVLQSAPDLACLKLACPVSKGGQCTAATGLLCCYLPIIKTTQAQISGETLAHAVQTMLWTGEGGQAHHALIAWLVWV